MELLGALRKASRPPTSWLSLVAETAGVPGAVVARAELYLADPAVARSSTTLRAIVQIRDPRGTIVEATQVWGEARDFATGVFADLACDLTWQSGTEVVAWIDETSTRPSDRPLKSEPRSASAPAHASHCRFEPKSMKLMLSLPKAGLTDAA